VRNHIWLVLVPIFVFGAIAAAFTYFLPSPENWFLAGVAASCIPWTLIVVVRDILGLASIGMGVSAEQWTSQELRRFAGQERRTEAGRWFVLDHVPMSGFDIDHVLIGPGGVVALETKWSNEGWDKSWSKGRLEDARETAQANARHVKALLRAEPHRMDVPVMPLVVLWPGQRNQTSRLPDGTVYGNRLIDFCKTLGPDPVDAKRAATAARAIASFVRKRDQFELQRKRAGPFRRWWLSIHFDPLRD
jgi:hypothetical protein